MSFFTQSIILFNKKKNGIITFSFTTEKITLKWDICDNRERECPVEIFESRHYSQQVSPLNIDVILHGRYTAGYCGTLLDIQDQISK